MWMINQKYYRNEMFISTGFFLAWSVAGYGKSSVCVSHHTSQKYDSKWLLDDSLKNNSVNLLSSVPSSSPPSLKEKKTYFSKNVKY